MIQIRKSVFETNSSSIHSLTMCTEADWLNWERGSIVLDSWFEEFISKKQAEEIKTLDNYFSYNSRYFSSPEEFFEYAEDRHYETFTRSLKGIISFGYYGYN